MLETITQNPVEVPTSLRTRLRDRHRLRRIDRLGVKLGRFDAVDSLLLRVHDRLAAGWVQDAWFTTVEEDGVRLHVGTLRASDGATSEQACLVAAVAIEAMPNSITGPIGGRAIGTMWNTLHGGGGSADWSTPPGVTAARAYDLVRWNDAADRRQTDVLALVQAARRSVSRSANAVRSELARA